MDDWRYEPARDLGLPAPARWRSALREPGLPATLAGGAWKVATLCYLKCYHRFEVEGAGRLPAEPPFVMVCNHSSHLDAIALAAPLPTRFLGRAFPLAAGDTFFERPATSAFAACILNALPVWRRNCGAHALDTLRDRLINGRNLFILFPEGTRSRTGQMAPFKPGIGRLVAASPVPVVPCHLRGAWEALPPGAAFPRPARLRLRIGPPLRFDSIEDNRAGWARVAAEAETAVRTLATP